MGVLGGLLNRLNESMVIDSSLCSRVRSKKSSCSACMDVCHRDAVSITKAGGKVQIDWDKCNSCGECYSACKNSVFQIKLADKSRLYTTLKQSITETDQAVFACKERWDDITVGVPSLAFADRKIMLKAALIGAKKIVLKTGECEECSHESCLSTINKEIEIISEIFRSTGDDITIETIPYGKPEKSKARKRLEDTQVLNRREFFGLMGQRAKQSVGQVVYSLSENDGERGKTVLTGRGNIKRTFTDDLKLFGGEELLENLRGKGILPGVSLEVDKCNKCGVCERMCAFGVYTCEYETVKGRRHISAVRVYQDKCAGCGICAQTCMSKAITVHKAR